MAPSGASGKVLEPSRRWGELGVAQTTLWSWQRLLICRSSVGADERGAWDVGRNASRIAGEQWPARDGGVRADQEVREHGVTRAVGAPIGGVSVAGEERGLGWDVLDGGDRGQASRSVSMRMNRGKISASTTALRISAPRCAALTSCASDQESQRGSSVKTSSRTLLSTTVPARLTCA
jgi:hypothetical protein